MLLQLWEWLRVRLEADRGATMVEYGLLIVLIAVVVSAAAFILGGNLANLFNRVAGCLAAGGPC
jgi:pilus assembly protein Flp/PilA